MTFVDLKDGSERLEVPSETILCLGNFDGVHKGHRSLISTALNEKINLKSQYPHILAGVWLFRAYPSHFLQGDSNLITDIERKLDIFRDLSLDFVILADFPELCSLSASEFVHDILEDRCRCKAAICGFNHHFAKDGSGNSEFLKANFSGKTIICPPITEDGVPVSSTLIRSLISDGKIEKANDLLQSPFTISGTIEHGFNLGTKLGFPTINQILSNSQIMPRFGVYASRCIIDGKIHNAITNIGIRPTVSNNSNVSIETFIFDFNENIYGKKVNVQLISFLRDEQKFDSILTLKNAISSDIETAKRILKHEKHKV